MVETKCLRTQKGSLAPKASPSWLSGLFFVRRRAGEIDIPLNRDYIDSD